MLPKINETHHKNCRTLRRGRPCNLKKQIQKINGRYRIHAIQNNTKKRLQILSHRCNKQWREWTLRTQSMIPVMTNRSFLMSSVVVIFLTSLLRKNLKKQMMKSKTMMIFYDNVVGNLVSISKHQNRGRVAEKKPHSPAKIVKTKMLGPWL